MARREWRGLELVDVEPDEHDDFEPDAAAVAQHSETFEAFYLREFPRLVALARALVGDAQAQDIAQEAMVVAFGRWDEISKYAAPAGWVRGVCSHKAVSSVRRRLAESRAVSRLRVGGTTSSSPAAPVDDERFWHEVRRLPTRQAQATALFYALDMSVADIAVTLDCSDGTVKAHLSRARSTLAERLRVEEGAES